ncbi:MAG: outer membrane beta-barrel protein [Mongoliitalea sp.]
MNFIKTNYLLLLLCFISWAGIVSAQETDSLSSKKILKQKEYKVFGSQWDYTKYEDGSFSFQTIDKDVVYYQDKKRKKIDSSLNFDLGINQWVDSNTLPQVKPWGSWAFGINYGVRRKFGNHFSIKPMLGVNWYNFKFEDRNLQALRSPNGIVFEEFQSGGGTKSKISASYANLTLMSYFHSKSENFRIGIGPYAGMRLGGRGKFVYRDEDNRRNKEFQRVNMFANDFRYGVRGEVGVGKVDLFVNYDLNEYFQQNKGPQVQTISFGIIL